ncbi:MAG TPA: carboxypeptidase regulatory-like domain-containing protein [Gemmatimonadaceae bacterium]|nr:carboxypeptidase regulatory-like domain-containing protein [Gemmatimonadaceae bacterium]
MSAQGPVVCGTVTDSAGAPIYGATIAIGGAADSSAIRVAQIDSTGAYSLRPAAASTYSLTVRALGYTTVVRQLSAASAIRDTILADFQLAAVAEDLPTVKVRGQRPHVVHDAERYRSAPGVRRVDLDVTSGLSGDLTGDLTAALAMVPGVVLIPGADGKLVPTVFGVGADQNGGTLNGSDFGIGMLPRDGLLHTVRVATYDPKFGRFGGLQVSTTLPSGTNTRWRNIHLTVDDPLLQWSVSPSAGLGGQYRDLILSGRVSGPLSFGRKYLSTAFQLERRTHDVATLGTANAVALEGLGVSPDSVAKLNQEAAALALPVTSPRAPSAVVTTSGSAMARVDLTPGGLPLPTTSPVLYVMASGEFRNSSGLGLGPTALQSRAQHTTHRAGQLQLNYAPWFLDVLNETKLTLFAGEDRARGDLALPGASLLLLSKLHDGSVTPAQLQLGGSSGSDARSRRWGAQVSNQSSWMTWNRAHTFEAYLDAEVEHLSSSLGANTLGTFSFNSLADLANGAPSAFERRFGTARTSTTMWRGALALSDIHALTADARSPLATSLGSADIKLQYGLRFDLERFTGGSAYNAAIDSIFGRDNGRLPNSVRVEPMVGFTWLMAGPGSFDGERNRLSGGIREYRGALQPEDAERIALQSGLPSGIRELGCYGPAAPFPDWSAYASSVEAIPEACVDGTAASPFVESSPSVLLYAPDFSTERNWRGELAWRWILSEHLQATLGVAHNITLGRIEGVDLNFDPSVRFTLADEADRPVFIAPDAIAPATGVLTATESRRSDGFGHVTELRSRLESKQTQYSAGLEYAFGMSLGGPRVGPAMPTFRGTIGLNYTHASGRAQSSGFAGTTGGDPRVVEWGPGFTPEHNFQLVFSGMVGGWFTVSAAARLSSGYRYTPLVGSDINGDGYANDRAFVFDPRSTMDPEVAAGMAQLLASAPGGARRCLERQLGRIGAPASCTGPWSASLGTISLMLDSYRLGLGNRGSLTIFLNNALGGVDRLLHGEEHRHGWGEPSIPDPGLLTVTGFDADARRFVYAVNPRFGTTTASHFLSRNPFRVTLDLRLYVGPDREREQIRYILESVRESNDGKLDERDLTLRLQSMASTPVLRDIGSIGFRADSLGLSDAQFDSLDALKESHQAARDSIYAELAGFIVAHGGSDDDEVQEAWRSSISASMWKEFETAMRVRALLSPEQIAWLDRHGLAPSLHYTRSYMERETRGVLFPR